MLKNFFGKKITKIILFNLIAVVLILFVMDFVLFNGEKAKYLQMVKHSDGIFKKENLTHFAKEVPQSRLRVNSKRHVIKKADNGAILLAGCSYTYGTGLTEKENFSYNLSKFTDKNIYNLGIEGGSPYDFLYLVQQKDFRENYKNVDLVIYTYISDHLNRLNEYLKCEVARPYCNLRMIKKNGKYEKASEWYRYPSKIFLFRMVLKYITQIKNNKVFYDKNTTEFADIINETYKQLKTDYPDVKFVFWVYAPEDKEKWLYEKLDGDIKIISTDEFSDIRLHDKKYKHDRDPHPSKDLWKEITPELAEFIGL